MKIYLFSILLFMGIAHTGTAQPLILEWKTEAGTNVEVMGTNRIFNDTIMLFNNDAIPDLVLVRQNLSEMGILDGKTRQLLESFDLSGKVSCNNGTPETFQAYFFPRPTAFEEIKITIIGFINNRGVLEGSRADDQVILDSNGLLSFPCTYLLRGIADFDNDGSPELLFANKPEKAAELWGFQ